MLVSIDFKQIELRLCACISKDEELIHDLQNPDDFFSSVASKMCFSYSISMFKVKKIYWTCE